MPATDVVSVEPATVLQTSEEADLQQISLPNVQAVIWVPARHPAWFEDLAAAVRAGSFEVGRAVVDDASVAEVEGWLEARLPAGVVAPEVCDALKQDVLHLVERLCALTTATRFMVRALTDLPSQHCGYHVDTVPPGAPPWGLLRVYSGAGTDYVDPANVIGMREVYRYMSRRERLVRQLAGVDGDREAGERLLAGLAQLDEERAFLRDPARVATAPAGSIVAFKHLDVRRHWSDHAPGMAWIHCSPMQGERRFLVNVTARAPLARRSAPPGQRAIAP